jgi:hypothetical protein
MTNVLHHFKKKEEKQKSLTNQFSLFIIIITFLISALLSKLYTPKSKQQLGD